jgi:hypothetical protein
MKGLSKMGTIAAGIALLAGCVTGTARFTSDIVGPVPSTSVSDDSTNGTLVVYSAYKRNADFNSIDDNRPEHSDYKILSNDGRLLRRVHNLGATPFEDAVTVELPAGKYQVVARVNGYGYLTIPVLIESQRSTVLHLEGGGFWPEGSGFNQTNAVRLPDGQIIGWKGPENN